VPGEPLSQAERRGGERRQASAWSLTYGSFRPRRRLGRRHRDHERILLDWHEPHVLYLAIGIVLMSCVDAMLTLNLLAIGAHELNPLMRGLIVSDVQHFLAVKIGLTCGSVVLLGLAARRPVFGLFPAVRLLQLFCAGYGVLLVWELWLLGSWFAGLSSLWEPWTNGEYSG
jgi:hypothetical protein